MRRTAAEVKRRATVDDAVEILSSPISGVFGTLSSSSRHFAPHWHDVYGFGVILDGAQKWRSGRGTVRGYEGDAICTNPGEVHDGEPLGARSRRWFIVSVDPTVMRQLAGMAASDVEFRSPVMHDAALVRLFGRLHAQLERLSRAPLDASIQLAFEEALASACTLVAARHASTRVRIHTPPVDMRRVRDRLGDDLRHAPTLAELAALAGLSRYQTLRRFTRVYGVPPHAWLRNGRVERARRLIEQGMSLSFAAQTCGFADQSHMTRCFKRHFGTTPGAWQRAVRR